MIKRNTTIGNYSYNMVGTTWEAVTDVVIVSLIARHLSLSAFGDYSFIMAFVAVFRVLCGVSLPVIVTREIAVHQEEASEVVGASLAIQVAASAITFGLVAVVINVIHDNPVVIRATYWAISAVIFDFFSVTLVSVARGFERMEYGAYRTIIAQSVFLGLLVVVVKIGGEKHFMPVFQVYLVAHLCGFSYAVYVVFGKFVSPSKRIDVALCKYLFLEAYPIALRRFIRRVNFRIDTILLNFLKGNIYSGVFHGAYKISQGLMFVGEALVVSVFPVLSRHYVRSRESMDRLYDRSFRFLAISGGFLGVLLFTFSRELIIAILGRKYLQVDYVVKVFAAMIVFMFLSKLAERMLIAGKRQLLVTGIAAVALLVNVVFDLAFIPRWGTVGASLATVLSEIVLFVLGLYYTYRYVSDMPGHVHILKVVFVFTLTCIVVNVCVDYVGRPASYVCGPALYIGAVMALGLTPREDLKELLSKLFRMIGVGPRAASHKDTIL